jgi:hypothetical protein
VKSIKTFKLQRPKEAAQFNAGSKISAYKYDSRVMHTVNKPSRKLQELKLAAARN